MRNEVFAILMLLSLTVSAQDIRIRGISRVRPDDRGQYMLAGVVPGSHYLLVTGEGYTGLSILDWRNGEVRHISNDVGAGYEPAVTSDGRNLIYRSNDFSGSRKLTTVYCYDMEAGKNEIIISRERDVLTPSVYGNTVLIKSGKAARVKDFDTLTLKSTETKTFVVIEDMTPVLYRGDEKKTLKPNGEGYYIWASLSPDGSKIVYNYQGRGTYVCDTEGKILHHLGRVDAPRWLNDNIVIGMDDRDDGHRITSSELVYYSLPQKSRKILTRTPDRAEVYPRPFDSGSRIAFSTVEGGIYVMKIRVR
jgi:Tol biopolymer transport system component